MSKLQVDEIVNKEDTGSVSLPKGAVVTGVITATTYHGDGSGLVGVITQTPSTTSLKDSGGNTKVEATSTGAVVTGIITATSGSFGSVDISGNLSVGGTVTKEDVTNVDSVGVITARSGINVPAGGINISDGGLFVNAGVSTMRAGAAFDGLLTEAVNIVASKITSGANIELQNGMVHYYSTQENSTGTPDILWNTSTTLNSMMQTGEAITVSLIISPSAGGYYPTLQIDGANVTPNWVGGSAPSDGGTSGLDIYTYNIIKTGSATYQIIANHTKTS